MTAAMTHGWKCAALVAVAGMALCDGSRAADFNGDGRQDLVWRNHAGNAVVWQMSGTSVAARTTLAPALDAGSAIVGSGNFFGSGTGAIAWVDSNHQFLLWRVAAGSVAETCSIAGGIDPGWSFLGSGDLDADGIDDLAWRAADGSVHILVMNGCTVTQSVTLSVIAGSDLTFLGIGDVDGHSAGTLFWRAAGGDVALWRLRSGFGVQATTIKAGSYAGWNVAAIGDFDGDGRSDILWRSGTQTALWFFNGTKYTVSAVAPGSASVFAAPDSIFSGNFDSASPPAPPLSAQWTILGAADLNGDGRADVVLADTAGNTAFWQMQGATIQSSGFAASAADMPYTASTGWRMAMDRPSITKISNQVTVDWSPVGGVPDYVVYASAGNFPAQTGVPVAAASPPLQFGRNDAGYADKRYFAVSARYLGIETPPSPEAYIVEYVPHLIPEWGAMALGDINRDGCVDVLNALGDCNGNFTVLNPSAMGLDALGANGRKYRDVRYADFDGDGIDDLISNVYSDIDDSSSQVLFFRGTGDNHFVEDSDFLALNIRGYGETIVVADFNGDGYLDVFLPQYSMNSPDEHSWLLLNDGTGHFIDVSDLTGVAGDPGATVALRGVPSNCRVEGAQAADVNGDGRIDLYVASHLFINQGNDAAGVPHFLDVGPRIEPSSFIAGTYAYYACVTTTESPVGLPLFHDEGAKFFDFDNSGRLSLLIDGAESTEAGGSGVGLFTVDGLGYFTDRSDAVPHFYMYSAWGIQAVDADGDGLSDFLLIGGCDQSFVPTPENNNCVTAGNPHVPPHLMLHRGDRFVQQDFYQDGLPPDQVTWWDSPATADFDMNGSVDLALRSTSLVPFINQASSFDTILVSVLGENGERNQFGRVVHVSPQQKPGVVMTQVVDGGSGYLANSQYELTFAAPYAGAYTIAVRFAGGAYSVTAHAGDHVTLRANGTYAIQ